MSRFPFPIPWGWFHAGYSNEVAAGEVKAVQRFGRAEQALPGHVPAL